MTAGCATSGRPAWSIARGRVRGVDWHFNAWGGLERRAVLPLGPGRPGGAPRCSRSSVCERYRAPLVNEGGAIHVDGQGTALVTEECLLNPNRNPGLSTAPEVERCAARVPRRKPGDLARSRGRSTTRPAATSTISPASCARAEVCLTWTERRRDPQYAISRDAWERLHDARDARGRRLKVTRLPMPGPLRLTAARSCRHCAARGHQGRVRAGERLAASYVNFYIANGGIIMPLLDPRTDRLAAQRLKRAVSRAPVVAA